VGQAWDFHQTRVCVFPCYWNLSGIISIWHKIGKERKNRYRVEYHSCPTCVTYILQNIQVSFTTFRQLYHKGNNNFFFWFCFLFSFGFGGSEKGEPAFIIIVLHFSNHWAAKFLYNLFFVWKFYVIYWVDLH